MLKQHTRINNTVNHEQPPSGGCVLKHYPNEKYFAAAPAAAFGRLCVETSGVQ